MFSMRLMEDVSLTQVNYHLLNQAPMVLKKGDLLQDYPKLPFLHGKSMT